MTISAAEFRTNMKEYLKNLRESEEIYITRHGKIVAAVVDPLRLKQPFHGETTNTQEQFEAYLHLTREYLQKLTALMEEQ